MKKSNDSNRLPYLKEIKTIKEFAKCDYLRTYQTKNSDLFVVMIENRGAENGIENKRVKQFLDLEKEGKFVAEDCHIRVNVLGRLIDGTHKYEKCRRLGQYINFMIVPDRMFNNVDRRTFANNVSLYNAINSAHRDKNNLESSIACGERCALNVVKLVAEVTTLKSFVKNPLTPTRVIGIVTNFEKGTTNRKQLREVYCNDTYADIMETSEFKTKFNSIIEFMQIISRANKNIRSYGVVRQLIVDLKTVTTTPDWDKVNMMLVKYITKDKDFDKMGDRQSDFKTISNGVIALLLK